MDLLHELTKVLLYLKNDRSLSWKSDFFQPWTRPSPRTQSLSRTYWMIHFKISAFLMWINLSYIHGLLCIIKNYYFWKSSATFLSKSPKSRPNKRAPKNWIWRFAFKLFFNFLSLLRQYTHALWYHPSLYVLLEHTPS